MMADSLPFNGKAKNPGSIHRRGFKLRYCRVLPVAIMVTLPLAMMVRMPTVVIVAYSDANRAYVNADDGCIRRRSQQPQCKD